MLQGLRSRRNVGHQIKNLNASIINKARSACVVQFAAHSVAVGCQNLWYLHNQGRPYGRARRCFAQGGPSQVSSLLPFCQPLTSTLLVSNTGSRCALCRWRAAILSCWRHPLPLLGPRRPPFLVHEVLVCQWLTYMSFVMFRFCSSHLAQFNDQKKTFSTKQRWNMGSQV